MANPLILVCMNFFTWMLVVFMCLGINNIKLEHYSISLQAHSPSLYVLRGCGSVMKRPSASTTYQHTSIISSYNGLSELWHVKQVWAGGKQSNSITVLVSTACLVRFLAPSCTWFITIAFRSHDLFFSSRATAPVSDQLEQFSNSTIPVTATHVDPSLTWAQLDIAGGNEPRAAASH